MKNKRQEFIWIDLGACIYPTKSIQFYLLDSPHQNSYSNFYCKSEGDHSSHSTFRGPTHSYARPSHNSGQCHIRPTPQRKLIICWQNDQCQCGRQFLQELFISLKETLNPGIWCKISNLFTYTVIITSKPKIVSAQYAEFTELMLWHLRLAHTKYHTIEKMSHFKRTSGLLTKIHINDTVICINCPYEKQACAPFKEREQFPLEIGNIIVSDLCGPFETSTGGYRYFITWIDLKTHYASLTFILGTLQLSMIV